MGTEYTRELKHKESTANHWAVIELFIVYVFTWQFKQQYSHLRSRETPFYTTI